MIEIGDVLSVIKFPLTKSVLNSALTAVQEWMVICNENL